MENSDTTKKRADEGGTKKDTPVSLQKICLVCGDKALGYNFNAISCESCKAFFRRNALTIKEFKCPFTNSCEITVVTRRFCQKCRLVKCLAVGMVKEFIMSDEDKAEKRRKIEQNRAKKRHSSEPDDADSSTKHFRPDDATYQQDSSITQYDVNSATCSPNSTVQSELDSSLHSPPVYNQYVPTPVQHSEGYTLKVYPIDEKSVISRALYEQRMIEQYSMCDSVDNSLYADPPKQNTIR